jgi:hypothetical protein
MDGMTRWKLGMGVEPGPALAPVEVRAPVLDQLADVLERHPVARRRAGRLIGPAHAGQARPEIVETGLRQLGPERS